MATSRKSVWLVFNWLDFGKKEFIGAYSSKKKAWEVAKKLGDPRVWEEPIQ